MRKHSTLTLCRSGAFILAVNGQNHCGLHSGDQRVLCEYSLVVECAASTLDARGFLFEQTTIQKYFDSLDSTKHSCEVLSIKCAEQIARNIKRENPKCRILGMKLEISPKPAQMKGSAGVAYSFGSMVGR